MSDVDQIVVRYIVLLFHECGSRCVRGLQDVPAAIYLRETTGNLFTGRWEGPKFVWWLGWKISFTLGFDSRPPSPCSVLMPTELPGTITHTHTHTHIYIYIYGCERILKGRFGVILMWCCTGLSYRLLYMECLSF